MMSTTVSGQGFNPQNGSNNPFNGIQNGPDGGAAPTLVDLDGDGLLDAIVTDENGVVRYYHNTGNPIGGEGPVYVLTDPAPIPPPSSGGNDEFKLSFGDLDNDGDLDAITGLTNGGFATYVNSGTKTNPIFAQAFFDSPAVNSGLTYYQDPFYSFNYSTEGTPYISLADFDGDGDLDALIITPSAFHYLINTGTTTDPSYVEATGSGNPFLGFTPIGNRPSPSVGDIDGDGDLDVVVSGSPIIYYRNIGTKTRPIFKQIVGPSNPFYGLQLGPNPQLTLGDLDGDGDLDALIGDDNGAFSYLKNVVRISQQPKPASLTACVGNTVSTTTVASGDETLSYQWYRNTQTTDTPVPGQTSDVLSFTNVQLSDAGLYYLRVTGSGVSLYSDAFDLAVNNTVAISQQPASASTVIVGATVVVPVGVNDTKTVQWYNTSGPVTGQTSATLTLTDVQLNQSGSYSLVITSECNSVTSTAFNLTVNPLTPPSLTASATSSSSPISITANGCFGGTINWKPQGGVGTATDNIYTFSQPGNYTITASCTANGSTSGDASPLTLQVLPGGFAFTGVTMVSCELIDEFKGGYRVTFTPQLGGQNNNPVSFSVVNEMLPTTAPAPYTLRLYTDNPAIVLVANQAGNPEARYRYEWFATCKTGSSANQPPTTSGIPSQTILQGQPYQLPLTNYFSDPDQQQLTFSATGLPEGLSLNGSVISGTPSATGVSSVTVTAVDPGSLSVQANFTLTVQPTPTTPSGFTVLGVSTISCEVTGINGERRLTFTPQYGGVTADPISFSVVNEKLPTTDPGPYSLRLYTDNPVITLSAKQGTSVTTFRYEWLAACQSPARLGILESATGLQVQVLGNPVIGNSVDVEISGVAGQTVQLNLVDLQGRSLHQQTIREASAGERVSVPIGADKGLLMLNVSTSAEQRLIRLLKQ